LDWNTLQEALGWIRRSMTRSLPLLSFELRVAFRQVLLGNLDCVHLV